MPLIENKNKKTIILWSLVLMILGLFTSPVLAMTLHKVDIYIKDDHPTLDTSGRAFYIWHISRDRLTEDEVKKEIVSLDSLSYGQLKDKFGTPVESLKSNEDGLISIDGLESGAYYFREIQGQEGKYMVSPFIVNVPLEEQDNKIFPKLILKGPPPDEIHNKKKKKGDHHFFKYDEDSGRGLKGAIFKVTYIDKSGENIPVYRENMPYKVISDKDGNFSVSELDYGTYCLWEVEAPSGYSLLNGGVSFIIDENSKYDRTDIPNTRKYISEEEIKTMNPSVRVGRIPKTGDITLLISFIGGILLCIVGLKLIKEGKK